MLTNKRKVNKFKSGNKKITTIIYFDKKGSEFYKKLGKKKQAVVEYNLNLIDENVAHAVKLNSEMIGESSLKIEIKITEFVVPTNLARTEGKTKPGEFYLAIGIAFLSKKIEQDELWGYFFDLIRHEFAHTQDIAIKKGNNKYEKIFEMYRNNLLPWNLLISIDLMKKEGFAIWTEHFHKYAKAPLIGHEFTPKKDLFRKKVRSILKSEEPYSAYQLVGTLPYDLGYHIFAIITLDFLKKHERDHKLIDSNRQEYAVSKLFQKIDQGIFLYPSLTQRDYKQLYTYFKLLDRFKLIERYMVSFTNLGFSKRYFIFTDHQIKLFLELKKHLK
jgi:hypothetical protein